MHGLGPPLTLNGQPATTYGAAIVTAQVGLDKVAWAFDALGNPEEHCKIIVKP